MNLTLNKLKIPSSDNIQKIINLMLSISQSHSDLESKCIEPYEPSKLYNKNSFVEFDGYIWKSKSVNQTDEFDKNYWKQIGDNIIELTKDDILSMLDLSEEEIEGLSQIIDDTQVIINKTWSSSAIYTKLNEALDLAKEYTLAEVGKASGASYKVVSSTSEMTETKYIYLLSNGTSYDMYIYEEDANAATKIGDVSINLDNYYTRTECDDEYVKKTDYEVLEDSIGDVANLTTDDKTVVGAINEVDETLDSILDGTFAIGNAETVNGFSIFTAPSQLGISSWHIPDIVQAMPQNSMFIAANTTLLNSTDANNALPNSHGTLEITRPRVDCGRTRVVYYTGVNADKYSVYICNLDEENWVIKGWKHIGDGCNADKLDGYDSSYFLPATGGTVGDGTIMSPITVNGKTTSAYTKYAGSDGSLLGYLGFSAPNKPIYQGDDNTARELLHTGNIANYALALNGGGTVKKANVFPIAIQNSEGSNTYLQYAGNEGNLGSLGFLGADNPVYVDKTSSVAKKLIHEGNLSTTLDLTSTDTQVPSAKAVYDTLKESLDIKSITLETTITANPLYCWKSGNVVRIYTAGTITAALTAGTSIEIATLPEEFRPKYTWSKYFTYRITSDMGCVGLIEISTTTGIVTFNPLTVPSTGGVFRLDETFI